jgi:hypothetical protein
MKKKEKPGREGSAPTIANPRKPSRSRKRPELTLIRGSTLAALYARGSLNDRQMKAAVELREKWRVITGGMPAMNWMREKVDGGRMFIGPAGGLTTALDADRQVREALKASGMGLLAAEVILRVVCCDEALKVVALDFEDVIDRQDEARRARMEATQQAQRYVGRLLKDGLSALADHWYGRERRRDSVLGNALHSWLTVDAGR